MTDPTPSKNPFIESLGIEVIESAEERCVVAMTMAETHTNSLGLIHGGVIFSLADRALGLISNLTGQPFVTMDMHARYLRPAFPGQRIRAIAHRLHKGRETLFARIDVVDDNDRLIACFSGTAHILRSEATRHCDDRTAE